jgi:hypothetical protein
MKTQTPKKLKVIGIVMSLFLMIGLTSCGNGVEKKAIVNVNTSLWALDVVGSTATCTDIELGEKKTYGDVTKWKNSIIRFSDGTEGTCRVKENEDGSVEVYRFKQSQ